MVELARGPTLLRLDRAFINQAWNDYLPNSSLSSLTRHASDHVPLLVTISTTVPRPNCFRYESAWSLRPEFKTLIRSVCSQPLPQAGMDPGQRIVAKHKRCLLESKKWHKRSKPAAMRARDCRAIIIVVDLLEEERCLTVPKRTLCQLASDELDLAIKEEALYWRRCAKIQVAITPMLLTASRSALFPLLSRMASSSPLTATRPLPCSDTTNRCSARLSPVCDPLPLRITTRNPPSTALDSRLSFHGRRSGAFSSP